MDIDDAQQPQLPQQASNSSQHTPLQMSQGNFGMQPLEQQQQRAQFPVSSSVSSTNQQLQMLQQHNTPQQQQMQLPMESAMYEDLPMQDTPSPLPAAPPTSPTITTNQAATMSSMQEPPPAVGDGDIDAMLLQQFSCMGTTDHEDLISQFQSLMNNQINREWARFFLEMSNWNLQTAVGCYLDFCNFQHLPSMKAVAVQSPPEQNWRLLNDGNDEWPKGCYLISPTQTRRIPIPQIKPGKFCDMTASMPSNIQPIMWRMCTPNGAFFGDPIWMLPQGSKDTAADLAERMAKLKTSINSENAEDIPQVEVYVKECTNME